MHEHKEHKAEKQHKAAMAAEAAVDSQNHHDQPAVRAPSQTYQAPAGEPQAQQTAGYGDQGGQSWDGKQ